jgi:hypothetical protein
MYTLFIVAIVFMSGSHAQHQRCIDSEDIEIPDGVKELSKLERHSSMSSHGDVCRNPQTVNATIDMCCDLV